MESMLQANQFDPSMMIATSRPPLVDFTDEALKQVADRLEKNKSKGIHFGLTGGGCAGFSYEWGFLDSTNNEMIIPIKDNVILAIDKVSEMYIMGSEIDYALCMV